MPIPGSLSSKAGALGEMNRCAKPQYGLLVPLRLGTTEIRKQATYTTQLYPSLEMPVQVVVRPYLQEFNYCASSLEKHLVVECQAPETSMLLIETFL